MESQKEPSKAFLLATIRLFRERRKPPKEGASGVHFDKIRKVMDAALVPEQDLSDACRELILSGILVAVATVSTYGRNRDGGLYRVKHFPADYHFTMGTFYTSLDMDELLDPRKLGGTILETDCRSFRDMRFYIADDGMPRSVRRIREIE